MATYNKSTQVDEDLTRIYIYSYKTFGEHQANQYIEGLLTCLDNIANDPYRYPVAPEDSNYRRCIYKADKIFYRIVKNNTVEIMTIFGRQDHVHPLKKLL